MKLGITLASLANIVGAEFVKGTFHQHATQPWRACHRAASGIQGGGAPGDDFGTQDDGGTDADVLLDAIAKSKRGYAFVGIAGNEELPTQPKHNHGLVMLNVTENQMGAICTKGEKHCKHPCNPVPPEAAGPWSSLDINNLHREYIQGVPGYFIQHPTTDPERDQIFAYMLNGTDSLLRGLEVYNAWQEQAWDLEVPLDDVDIDSMYPVYKSGDCTAWSEYTHKGSCVSESPIKYWDSVLRTLKRPIYGLADDDGFDYMGDSDEPVYPHGKKDVQTNTSSWFRFGAAWSMVDVPAGFTGADVSKAVDEGKFYASTGIELAFNVSSDVVSVMAPEPVVFGVAGGIGNGNDSSPLGILNMTLCADSHGVITNVGCSVAPRSLPPASTLRLDLREISGSFFYIRVQAMIRTRYPIVTAPGKKANKWEFQLGATPNPADVMEGRLLRATGKSRRPLVVEAVSGDKVQVVKHFSDGYGEITPDQTTVDGIDPGTDQLVAERWAWMQPIFRKRSGGQLFDPFSRTLFV